jgi:Tfp pilus assembly protein PilP
MKARTIALLWLLAAVVVCAQTAPPSQKVAPAGKPAAAPAKPAAAPASPFAKPAAAPAAKAAPAKASQSAKVAKPAVKAPKPAAGKTAVRTSLVAKKAAPKGMRDPFVNPIVRAEGPSACATGKKCLAINTILLKGIVKSQVGMIAVVESSTRKVSYFLRENDPVFNGYVVKITRDTVVFRENVMDNIGRQSTREVVKTVVAPVV